LMFLSLFYNIKFVKLLMNYEVGSLII